MRLTLFDPYTADLVDRAGASEKHEMVAKKLEVIHSGAPGRMDRTPGGRRLLSWGSVAGWAERGPDLDRCSFARRNIRPFDDG